MAAFCAFLLLATPVWAQHGAETGRAEETATEHAQEEHGGGIMDVNPGLMIWTVVTFTLLLVVLRFVAWKPLIAALEAREQRIQEAVEQAERARNEGEELLARHRQQLDAAKAEAHQIIEEGRADAQRLGEQIKQEARADAEESKERARKEVELAADQAKKELWEESARLSTLLAERILRRSLNGEDHRKLVDEVLDELRSVRPTSSD
ncbi:MAG: F0F1 ATP synthase subunit B [Candidatus Latescibacterota bacterium]|nr:MAG: F0F1 ATP synthase subunit B [Candidatus Latescibacterota bacterium]